MLSVVEEQKTFLIDDHVEVCDKTYVSSVNLVMKKGQVVGTEFQLPSLFILASLEEVQLSTKLY